MTRKNLNYNEKGSANETAVEWNGVYTQTHTQQNEVDYNCACESNITFILKVF